MGILIFFFSLVYPGLDLKWWVGVDPFFLVFESYDIYDMIWGYDKLFFSIFRQNSPRSW